MPPRWPALSPFSLLVLVTSATTYALIVLGGVVRTTGSGDACPDWPRCHGQLIPPLEGDVLIEFSHRLLASVVGLLVLAVAVVAWRSRRHVPVALWGSTLALVLLIAQVGLGGATVLNDLSPGLVTGHLALAAALLAVLLVVLLDSLGLAAAGPDPSGRREAAFSFRNVAAVAALATFGLMITGAYVRATGASLAYRDWPLFDGQLWPEGGRLAMIHATHRLATLVAGSVTLYAALHAWRSLRWHRPIVFVLALVLALYVAQSLAGAANLWTLLQPAAGSAHLGLAVAIWAALVAVVALAHGAAQPAIERAPAPVREPSRGLAEAPRQAGAGGGS